MPKASPIQNSFSGGEFGPKAKGRTDNERYKQGLEWCENYIPTTQGPLVRRPAEVHVTDAKDPSKPPTFIPFRFSANQNYILEFGDYYVRFYTNNGQILTSGTSYIMTGVQQWAPPGDFRTGSVTGWYKIFASRNSLIPIQPETGLVFSSVVSGSILEIPTPFSYQEAQSFKYTQKEDTLWITCSSKPIHTLRRFGNSLWTLQQFKTKDGPYLPENSYKTRGDVSYISLSPYIFDLVSSIAARGDAVYLSTRPRNLISNVIVTSSLITVVTKGAHPYSTGDKVFIVGVEGAVHINNSSLVSRESWSVTVLNSSTFILNEATFSALYTGSGMVYPALFQNVTKSEDYGRPISITQGSHRYFGYIETPTIPGSSVVYGNSRDPYELLSFTPASGFMSWDQDSEQALPNSSLIATWQLGLWNSSAIGFPTACTFHQDRIAFVGTPAYPQQVDMSKVGEYVFFSSNEASSLTITAANALQFTLASSELNKIRWIKSDAKGLLSGTFASEWNITPSSQGTALAPTNLNAAETSNFGSADLDAVKAGNAIVYAEAGARHLRELNYFFQVDTYRSTNLNEISEHITAPGIQRLAVQKTPIPIVWALTTEGKLLSMTYNRDDTSLKVGWAKHTLGGRSDSAGSEPKIKTMAVIPEPNGEFEQLWMATQRFVNGTTVLQIGYMEKFYDDDSNIEDAKYLDAGGTYNSPITITNIVTGSAAIVSALSHGFANDDLVKITKVIGMNSSITDADGIIFSSNLVNYHTFKVASSSVNAFFIKDFNGNLIDSRPYSVYVSGGEARKLVSTISGITWAKNETLQVLADGRIHPDTVVNSAGVLALQFPAAVVQVGYSYNSKAKTLRPDVASGDGSAIGKLKRVYRAALMLHDVGEFKIGPEFNKLTPLTEVELFLADQSMSDQPIGLFSGIVRDSVLSAFDFNGQLCFLQNSPLPGMVQSLTLMVETNDV